MASLLGEITINKDKIVCGVWHLICICISLIGFFSYICINLYWSSKEQEARIKEQEERLRRQQARFQHKEAKLNETFEKLNHEFDAQRDKYQQELNEKAQKYQKELESISNELIKKHETELDEIQKANDKLQKISQEKLQQLTQRHEQELNEKTKQFEQQQQNEKKNIEENFKKQQENLQNQLKELNERHETQLGQTQKENVKLQETLQQQLLELNERHKEELNKNAKRFEEQQKELNKQLLEINKRHQTELKEQQKEKEKSQQALQEMLQQQLKDLKEKQQKELEENAKKIEQQSKEWEEFRKQQIRINKEQILDHSREKFRELKSQIENIYDQIENDIKQYNQKLIQYIDQLKYVYKYHYDQVKKEENNEEMLNIVLLGQTGYGKSTFGNRLCGDHSKYGNQTCFITSTESRGCTKNTQKKIVRGLYPERSLSIIDTAGFFDPDHNDQRHVEDLVATLRGSGGINAFLVFGADRFDEGYQEILRNMTNIFGQQFWRHIIFVRPKLRGLHRENFENYKIGFREQIIEEFPFIDDTYSLQIFGLDTWDDYKRPMLEDFIKLIPETRFDCREIQSPQQVGLIELKENIEDEKLHKDKFKEQLRNMYDDQILLTLREIQELDEGKYFEYLRQIEIEWNELNQFEYFTEIEEFESIEFDKEHKKEVEIIDYNKMNFVESILPLIINDSDLKELYEKCKNEYQINTKIEKFHKKHPYQMVNIEGICEYIGNSCCDICPCDYEQESYNSGIFLLPSVIFAIIAVILTVIYFFKPKRQQPWNPIQNGPSFKEVMEKGRCNAPDMIEQKMLTHLSG